MTGDSRYSIRAVERVCDLLDLLQKAPYGVSLLQAEEVTSMPKSTVFRYLATLQTRGYVERSPLSGSYRPGPAFPTKPPAPARTGTGQERNPA
jgi:IclR family transcriptional regulator, acetate operon repressor